MIEQGVYSSQTTAPLKHRPSRETLSDEHEASLLDVLTLLAYRKWLIAKVTAIALLAGVTMCLVLPVRYTAITKIMPPQQTQSTASMLMSQLVNSGAGSLAAMAAGAGGLGLKNPNDIYIGLLTSRPVADAVIHKFDLAAVYAAKDMTAARKTLARNTVVESEKNGFISISVTDKDKRRVAGIANTYTEELRKLTKSLAVTEASQRRLFYEQQLKGAKDSLIVAEIEFQRVMQNKRMVAPEAQAKAIIEGIALLRATIATKEIDLQAIRSYSTEHNPGVQLAERELSSTKHELARLEQRGNLSENPDLGLEDVPSASLDYLQAEHELKYRQAMFDVLIKQLDAARLDEAKEAAIIQVVESAIEPDRRSSPQRTAIILASIMAGLFVGCLSALLHQTKKTLTS